MSEPVHGHEEMLDLVAAYALGVVTPAEAEDVRRHLAHCETCRAEYAALRPAVDTLALEAQADVDDVTAARMKRRLMAQVAPPKRRRFSVAPLVAAAAIVAFLATAFWSVGLHDRVAQLETQNADLSSPDAERYLVPGGTIVRNAGRVYVALSALPAPPAGHVYQVWTLARDAKAVEPSITFVPQAAHAVVQIPNVPPDLAAIAVSVEPSGGSRQPTTKPLFLRKLD